MKIDILTLFPKMFESVFTESIIKHAQQKEKLTIKIHNLRDFGIGAHKQVDDRPYGGGVGMILMIEPIYNAIQKLKNVAPKEEVQLSFQVKLKNTLDVSSHNLSVKNKVDVLDMSQEFITKINSNIGCR